jgi:hypothetical protein
MILLGKGRGVAGSWLVIRDPCTAAAQLEPLLYSVGLRQRDMTEEIHWGCWIRDLWRKHGSIGPLRASWLFHRAISLGSAQEERGYPLRSQLKTED